MESKSRSSKKRRRERLDSSEDDEEGFATSEPAFGNKRRKKTKEGQRHKGSIAKFGSSHVNSTTSIERSTESQHDQPGKAVEEEGSLQSRLISTNCDNDKNLASYVKKTYSSGKKNRNMKKERTRARNLRPRFSSTDLIIDENLKAVSNDLEKDIDAELRERLSGITSICSEDGNNQKRLGRDAPEENDGRVCEGIVSNCNLTTQSKVKNAELTNLSCLNSTFSDYCESGKVGENTDLNSPSILPYNQSNTEQEGIALGNGNVLATISSNIPVSFGSRIAHNSSSLNPGYQVTQVIPNIVATTSAVDTVTAPVVTYQQLPDVTQVGSADMSLNLDTDGADKGSQSTSIVSKNTVPYNHNSFHQSEAYCHPRNMEMTKEQTEEASLSPKVNHDISIHEKRIPREEKSLNTNESQKDGMSIPLVDLEESGSDHLVIEKENSPAFRSNSCPETVKHKKRENIQVPTGGQGQVTTSSLRVDNWGAYLLQRLEVLFDREQECDLTLKFSSGEVLKVHRAVVSACTSLISEPQMVERGEFTMPPELSYANVEPVIRFIYSGRLDVRGSRSEMMAIYNAAQRLQVSLLTRLMDRRFPYLTPSRNSSHRLPVWRRTPERQSKHQKQQQSKTTTKGNSPKIASPSGAFDNQSKAFGLEDSQARTSPDILEMGSKEVAEGGGVTSAEEEEEAGDGIYLLVTNSQKIAQANAAVRRKRPAEQARPTRFELEEDSENGDVRIATWSSKSSSVPPFFPTTSMQGQDVGASFFSSTSTTSADSLDSPQKSVHSASVPISSTRIICAPTNVARNMPAARQSFQSQDPFSLLSQSSTNDRIFSQSNEDDSVTIIEDVPTNRPSRSPKEHPVVLQENENIIDDDSGREGDELMQKISNICRQLEDRDSDDSESNMEQSFETNDNIMEDVNKDSTSSTNKISKDYSSCESSESSQSNSPVKSILKRKKDKKNLQEAKKHVSFPLDENNELINEVAIYSHAKEPSQSLLDVQKTVGSLRSSEDLSSPVKLTLSLKKKVLVNLALGESKTSEFQSSHRDVKGKSKKDGSSACQSTSQGVSQGDMSNHAKIISEVLKKYPHLVKDKKNIKVKILKKGSEKTSGGKLVKSKVQYFVLSENESKGKTAAKLSKSSPSSAAKGDSTATRGMQSSQTFECPECEDVCFTSYFTFKKHVFAEHKEKSSAILANVESVPYACYTCFLNEPLEFSDYCSYQQHMKDVHSKSEARLCSICGFRPGRKLELAYHLYTEHNKTPRNITFPKCDLCDHVAITEAALLKHRSQHANADNYTCSVCGVAFRSFGALQGHMQTKLCQNKPSVSHKCPYCPQTFARSYNLKAHCKSNHRSHGSITQTSSGSSGDQITETPNQEGGNLNIGGTQNARDRNMEEGNVSAEGMCETSISTQSSSEAEALSTVASSLAASLGLPEESMTQYMYTQGSKLDFPGTLEGDKYEEGLGRSNSVSVHLVETATPVSGYPGDMSVCHDRTYTCQAQMPSTTSVGTLYPVGVVPSQIVSGPVVSGQLLPSHVLPGNCVSVSGGSVIGAAPHSWTYVTYQVPTTSDDLPAVMTEATTLPSSSLHPDQSATVEVTMAGKTTNSNSGITSSCENPNSLVMMTSSSQVGMNQSSQLPTTQHYDTFSSQFV